MKFTAMAFRQPEPVFLLGKCSGGNFFAIPSQAIPGTVCTTALLQMS